MSPGPRSGGGREGAGGRAGDSDTEHPPVQSGHLTPPQNHTRRSSSVNSPLSPPWSWRWRAVSSAPVPPTAPPPREPKSVHRANSAGRPQGTAFGSSLFPSDRGETQPLCLRSAKRRSRRSLWPRPSPAERSPGTRPRSCGKGPALSGGRAGAACGSPAPRSAPLSTRFDATRRGCGSSAVDEARREESVCRPTPGEVTGLSRRRGNGWLEVSG